MLQPSINMSMNLDSNVSLSTKSVHYQNKSDDENEKELNKVISRSVSCPKVIESVSFIFVLLVFVPQQNKGFCHHNVYVCLLSVNTRVES